MTKVNRRGLSPKQIDTLSHILGAKSYDEACRQAGITRVTLYKWLKEPSFKSELDDLHDQLLSEAVDRLKKSATKAVDVLDNLLLRDDCPAVQRAAANDILNQLAKFKEILEFKQRLETVEARLNNAT
jgi:transposase-like protein